MAFPHPSELLPHTGRAVLIDEVLADAWDETTVLVHITPQHAWFEAGKGVPVWVGLEMMAQTVAVHGGLLRRADQRRSGRGMLLGTRHFNGHVPWFTEGSRLIVHGEHAFGREGGGMAACACRIEADGECLAEATLIILEDIGDD